MLRELIKDLGAGLFDPERRIQKKVKAACARAERGEYEAAERDLLDLHRKYPKHPDVLHLLGLLARQRGEPEVALKFIEQAIELAPEVAVYHGNLGACLLGLRRFAEAQAALSASLRLDAEQADTHVNLAGLLVGQGRFEVAFPYAQNALRLQPDNPIALNLAGSIKIALNQPELALEYFQREFAITPDSQTVRSNLYRVRSALCDWPPEPEASNAMDALREAMNRVVQAPPGSAELIAHPYLANHVGAPGDVRLGLARVYAHGVQSAVANLPAFEQPRSVAPKRVLRIGYVSSDFCRHATVDLIGGLFTHHDRERFTVYSYSFGWDDGSEERRRVMRESDVFRDIVDLDPMESARRIHDDGIDILLDVKGYTANIRPEIFALRAAPIQINYLAYPETMGAPFIDYMVADRVVIPPGSEQFYAEQIAYLPHCYQANDGDAKPSATGTTRADAGLPADAVVFCCFNNVYKIEPTIFSVWMRILQRVPRSVLWLFESNTLAPANLRREAERRGVDPQRLIFAAGLPKDQHLERLTLADLFLDTYHINAHTTASDALGMGVPLITCPQDNFSSRVAASLLTTQGLAELIVPDLAAYEEVAVALAGDTARRQALRDRLIAARHSAPLFDTVRYARNLERMFELMWQNRVDGNPPAAFSVLDCLKHPQRD